MRFALVLVAAAGCRQIYGLDDPQTSDAHFIEGSEFKFVATRVLLPLNNSQAEDYSFDLNGDAMPDNQLSQAFVELATTGGAVQDVQDTATLEGKAIALVDIQTTSFTMADNVGVTVVIGQDPKPAACNTGETVTCVATGCTGCGHHLNPTGGTFTAITEPSVPANAMIDGTGLTVTSPGTFQIQIAPFDTALPLDLIGARARFTAGSGTGITAFDVGGGIPDTQVHGVLLPAIAMHIQSIVMTSCGMLMNPPGCGCAAGSPATTLLNLLDKSPADCNISIDEVMANSIIGPVLTPDVTIDGQKALSFGVRMQLEPAAEF